MKLMWAPKRIIATLVFLAAMGVTLYAAFGLESIILCLIMVGVQTLALIWYCLSYIPYARTLIIKFVKSTLCRPCFGGSSSE
jgi:Got1/Sft2-like family